MKSVMGYGAGFQALSLTTCVSHATLASPVQNMSAGKDPKPCLVWVNGALLHGE